MPGNSGSDRDADASIIPLRWWSLQAVPYRIRNSGGFFLSLSSCEMALIVDILDKAEKLLSSRIPSIVDFPAPRSKGSIHDFYSESIYWHPDPKVAGGLPYVRKEGSVNRNCFLDHRRLLGALKMNTSVLYKAYSSTGDRRYLDKLEMILDSFFIDEESRINPNLRYAEAVPGVCDGRDIGIVEFLKLLDIPAMVSGLSEKGVMRKHIVEGVSRWFREYCSWLSTNCRFPEDSASSYSSSYYLQLAVFSGI